MTSGSSQEFKRFDVALTKALSVSKKELQRREAEWKKQRKAIKELNTRKGTTGVGNARRGRAI
ncbi:MAG: hypothetical protein ACRDF4_07775 [Rhabdochlamydiaceae bacterium]